MNKPKKFALSLSGGGLSAYAYAGFVEELGEHDLRPSIFAGLSGGGILAVLLASNYSSKEIIEFIEKLKTVRLVNTHLSHFEIVDQEHLVELFRKNLRYQTFEDLPTPAVLFVSDIVKKCGMAINSGDIASALAATCSVYPLLSPVKRRGLLLSDGGFTTYYGANFLREMGMEKIVGVDVTGISEGIVRGILRAYYQNLNAVINSNTNYELREYPVDVDVKISFPSPSIFNFNRKAQHLYELGRRKAKQNISKIAAVTSGS